MNSGSIPDISKTNFLLICLLKIYGNKYLFDLCKSYHINIAFKLYYALLDINMIGYISCVCRYMYGRAYRKP